MTSKKQLWMLVGGNGAGKSTFYSLYLQPRGLAFINADILAKTLYPQDPESHSYDAARLAESMRERLLLSGQSFCFETVYSHPSKIDFVARAKALGYEVIMVLIHLQLVSLNQARVASRVLEGGHSVPQEKVEQRIPRTMLNVRKSIPLVDRLEVLDNSSFETPYQKILSIKRGVPIIHKKPLPDWADSLMEGLG